MCIIIIFLLGFHKYHLTLDTKKIVLKFKWKIINIIFCNGIKVSIAQSKFCHNVIEEAIFLLRKSIIFYLGQGVRHPIYLKAMKATNFNQNMPTWPAGHRNRSLQIYA